jgi:predicted acyltransferase
MFKRRGQIGWTLGLLLGYWILMVAIPFPGKGADPWVLGSNFAQYIDNILLKGHMYKPDFDPEGVISTIPAIAQVLLGYFAGLWLRSNKEQYQKITYLFIIANSFIIVALMWEFAMPINKQLWTSSYVVYTTGLALHFLAFSYWLIDIKGYTQFMKPFLIYGSNAILAYFGSSIVAKTLYLWTFSRADGSTISVKGFLFESILQPIAGNWMGSLLFPIMYIVIWLGILNWFYRKKIFFKI